MTDYPRFRAPRVDPDQVYRFYFGAPQVDLLFRLVDTLRGRARPVPFPALVACAAMAIAIAIASAGVSAQEQVRVRGTIESVEGDTFMVKARAGDLLRLKLAPNANVAASVKAQVSDIGKGAYIGVAALPQADGSLHALEAHIFHDSMRGTGEGHRPWDLLPQSTMTNATVYDVVHAVDGHTVLLRYKEGEQRILIPSRAVIVSYLPGRREELVPGAAIFVPAAVRQSDGTLQVQRIMVGRDTAPPQ